MSDPETCDRDRDVERLHVRARVREGVVVSDAEVVPEGDAVAVSDRLHVGVRDDRVLERDGVGERLVVNECDCEDDGVPEGDAVADGLPLREAERVAVEDAVPEREGLPEGLAVHETDAVDECVVVGAEDGETVGLREAVAECDGL